MRKCILKMAVLFAALLALSFLYDTVQDLDYEAVAVDSAVADLTGFDFSDKIALIRGFNWEYYGAELYTPEDFTRGDVAPPDISNAVAFPADYATHRVTLRLQKGVPTAYTAPAC